MQLEFHHVLLKSAGLFQSPRARWRPPPRLLASIRNAWPTLHGRPEGLHYRLRTADLQVRCRRPSGPRRLPRARLHAGAAGRRLLAVTVQPPPELLIELGAF